MGKTQDIHAAARSGDIVAVQTIISSNPLSVNSRDKHSRTPLFISLIRRSLNPRLHLAAWAGQAQVVNLLCQNKADVGAAAMDDMGAIHFAAQKGHLEVVRTLVSSGISVKCTNRKGMTPLHYAVQGSYFDLIKYLVKKGANISIKNKAGKSPLDLASTDEIRSLLNCPSESKETDKTETESKTEDNQAKAVSESELKVVSEGPTKASENEDDGKEKDESNKRKVEDDVNSELIVETKKKKVALNHLLTSDDTLEEEY
ncbi:putative ankyrin repeat family protein [Tanacetum coccineum]